MADTVILTTPDVCEDCGKEASFKHWGFMVPEGVVASLCRKCVVEREKFYNEHGRPKEMSPHFGTTSTGMMRRRLLSQFVVLASVPVEGRRFRGCSEYGSFGPQGNPYIIAKALKEVPPEFIEEAGNCWRPPCALAEFGYFLFPQFPCPATTVYGIWHGTDGGWNTWDRAEMVLTTRGVWFFEPYGQADGIPTQVGPEPTAVR